MKLVLPADLGPITSSIAENDHPEWSAGVNYPLGARVIKAATHRVYESVIPANLGNDPPLAPNAWIDAGSTNRWAMFDAGAGPRSTAPAGPITVSVVPALPIDTLGLLDFDAATIRLRIIADGAAVHDETRAAAGSAAMVFLDLPHEVGQTIEVTIAPLADAPAAVGKLIAGAAFDLGDTETGAAVSLTDYSRRETDDFGITTVVRRAWAKRFTVRSVLPSAHVDAVQRRAAEARAVPALWIGDEAFGSLIAYGFYKDFQIELQLGTASYCSLEIEGLPSAEGVLPGGDPAAEGVSNFRVIRPISVSDAVLTSINVSENEQPAWNAIATYAPGARVIADHRIWESVVAGNLGNPPAAGSPVWVDVGPTNRWAMFDQALGSATTREGAIVASFTLPEPAAGLAVLDTNAAQVRVVAPGYDRLIDVAGSSATFLDLDAEAGAELSVTIIPAAVGASVSAGTLLFGPVESLGVTENKPNIGITDYSRKATDEFGNTTAVPRAWAKRMAAKSLIGTDAADAVLRRMASLRATPALWIADEAFEALTIYGFFRDFSVEMAERVSHCSFTIEGLSTAPAIPAPVSPDVSWSDIVDDDPAHPKPDDGADVTGDNTSKDTDAVGGVPAEDLLDGLAQLDADAAAAAQAIGNAQGQIDDLFETYGNTASSANSAAIAAAAAEVSEQARQNAQSARDDAQAARTASESARDLAINARTASQLARDDSQAARDAAGLAKQAAEQAEANAETHASSADGSAQAAAGSATVAEAKADDAGQSAGIAQAARLEARLTAGNLFPERIDANLLTSVSAVGSPASQSTIADTHPDWITDGGASVTPIATGSVAPIGVIQLVDGEIYEIIAEVQSIAGTSDSGLYARIMSADYSLLASRTIKGLQTTPAGRTILRVRIGRNVVTPGVVNINEAGAVYLRPSVLINRVPGISNVDNAALTKVWAIYARNITAQVSSELSAAAAYTSEQAASVHKNDAGVSAAASETNRVQAEAAAASASDAAQQALAVSVPDRYTTGSETNFSSVVSGSPDAVSTRESNATLAGFGPVFETSTDQAIWSQKSVFSAIPGRVYEVTVEADVSAVNTTGGTPQLRAEWRCLDASFASSLTPAQRYVSANITKTGTVTATLRVSDVANNAKGIQPWTAGTVHLRPYGRLSLNGGTATIDFKILAVRDITARIQAEIAASASAESASTAEARANAAGASATAAQQAATNAQTHAGSAETFSIAASESAADAEGSKDAAQIAATASAQSATNAGDSATAASGHASTAQTQAGLAGTRATAAQGSATTASTKAGEASTSAQQASVSAQDAASSASSASSSASVAASARDATVAVQKRIFAGDFNNGADYWIRNLSQSKDQLAAELPVTSRSDTTIETVAGVGKVLQSTAYAVFSERATRPVIDGQVLEVTIRTRILTNAPSGNHRHYFFLVAHAADGSSLGYTILSVSGGLTVAGGWQNKTILVNPQAIKTGGGTFTGGGPRTDMVEWRLAASLNISADLATQQIQSITIDDVTARESAKAAASAAATSESNAAASATTAGQRATAAQGSATTASTKAGEASTSASQASTSASNAQGFANTASQQAGVAAGHKDAAAGSASAAASSASTASTKATEATNAASAASASSLTAQTAAKGAVVRDGNPDFDSGAEGWAQSMAAARDQTPTPQWTVTASYEGRSNVLLTPVGIRRDLFSWKTWPLRPGATNKVRAGFRVSGNISSGLRMYVGIQILDAAGAAVGTNSGFRYVVTSQLYTTTGWKDLEADFNADTYIAEGASQFRLIAWANHASHPEGSAAFDYFGVDDATAETAAQSRAQAAQQSAVDADASRAAASQSASTAAQHKSDAASSASTASSQASVATGAASAAQNSAAIAASMGTGGLALDPNFQEYSTGVRPDRWNTGVSGPTYHARAERSGGLGYAWRQTAPASTNCYAAQRVNKSITQNGYYVIEADIRLMNGSLPGAGVLFRPYTATGNNRDITMAFATDPDETGSPVGSGTPGRSYRFRKLVQNTLPSATYFDLYAMAHWSALGSIADVADIIFEHVDVRPATPAEIAAGVALPDLQASVTQQSQVLASLDNLNTVLDTRNVNSPPSYYWANYPRRSVREFKLRTVVGVPAGPTYGVLTTTVPFVNNTGGVIQQVFVSSDEKFSYSRTSTSTTAWSAWANYVGDLTTDVGSLQTSYASLTSTVQSQGVTINSQAQAITTINGNVTTLFGRASLKVDVNGRITGWETNNNGQSGTFDIFADVFRILPTGGTTRISPFTVEGNKVRMQNAIIGSAVIEQLAVGTAKIAQDAISVPYYLEAADKEILLGVGNEITILEMPTALAIGDSLATGNAFAIYYATLDSTSSTDTSCRIRLYVNTGGSAWTLVATNLGGIGTSGANTIFRLPISLAASFDDISSMRLRVTGQIYPMLGHSAIIQVRDNKLVVFGGRR